MAEVATAIPGRCEGPDEGARRAGFRRSDPDRGGTADWRAEIGALCPESSDCRSRLCPDGSPVELAFVWPGDDMRVTCDPAPGRCAAVRLDAALALTTAALDDGQRAEVDRLRSWIASDGRFGAWVGARFRAGRLRRKLYLEIPAEAPWRSWAPSGCLSGSDVPCRTLLPVMAGFDAAAGTVETYWRSPSLHPVVFAAILRRAGLRVGVDALLDAVGRVTGRAVRDRLPGREHGVSLTFGPDGEARSATWYAHVEQVLGPDGQARSALLDAGRAAGWFMDRYAAASAPGRAGRVPVHGMIGFGLAAAAPVSVSITHAASHDAAFPGAL